MFLFYGIIKNIKWGDIMKKWQANLGLLLCSILWGIGFIATDIALEVMTPFVMQTFRFAIAASLLTLLFFKRLMSIGKEVLIAGSLTSLVFVVAMSLQSYGLVFTTISKSAFFTVTNVVWVPLILFIIYKTRISKSVLYGILIMLLGFIFLIFQVDVFDFRHSLLMFEGQMFLNFGDFLTIACAILFAVHIILTGIYARRYDNIQLLTVQMWGAAIFSFVCVFVFDDGNFTFNFKSLFACIIMGVFSSIIAFGLQIACQKNADTSQAAIILTTEAAFATVFSVLLGREYFYSGLVLGGILILSGVIIGETELSFLRKNSNKKVLN